jgi:hypothetical protein
MWAMEKLRYYLLGRVFVARVDHKPLVTMLNNKLNAMMEGWVDTILRFNFVTEYLPGDVNQLADSLSRCYDDVPTSIVKISKVSNVELTSNNTNQSLMMEAELRGKIIPKESQRQSLIEKAHALGHFSIEQMFRQLWHQGY